MMQIFPHVEDYIELLSGQDFSWIGLNPKPVIEIKLARYDVNIVSNMANNVVWGVGLTDRQAELAVKLILKYRRQFAKNGVDVSHIEHSPSYRLPLRRIDRSFRLYLENNIIKLKFPYNQKLVDEIRQFRTASQGFLFWDSKAKVWEGAFTEYNVNFLVAWAQKYNFEIDETLVDIFEKIIEIEKTPHEIKLSEVDDKLCIANAPTSLQEFVTLNVGEDHIRLLDYSGVLGYGIDNFVIEKYFNNLSFEFIEFARNHVVNLRPDEENLFKILDYARFVNRYPVFIYDPSLFSLELDKVYKEEFVEIDHSGAVLGDLSTAKIVYVKKIPKNLDVKIPLLVSTIEMMYGGRRLDWINRAEKIFYLCNRLHADKKDAIRI